MKKLRGILLSLLFVCLLAGCQEVPDDGLTPEERKALLEDKVPPVITVEEGYEVLQYYVGDEINLMAGIKGEDNLQGDLTSKITMDKSSFNAEKKGLYDIYYFLADYAGNNAEPVKRQVRLFDPESVKLIAHRGFSAREYENTVEAFRAGAEAGFWGLECDVRVTKDNKLVIYHDSAIPGLGEISTLTYDQIMQVELKNQAKFPGKVYKIASFQEYLEICKEYDVTPIIELKTPFTYQQIQVVIDMVETEEMMDKSVFISFSAPYLQYIRNRYSDIKLQLLVSLEDPANAIKSALAGKFDVSVAFTNEYFWTLENMDKLHEAGLEVAAWTVDSHDKMRELIALGVDYVTSNALNTLPPKLEPQA